MRTKHLLTKTLLAIAGLCVGSTSAWSYDITLTSSYAVENYSKAFYVNFQTMTIDDATDFATAFTYTSDFTQSAERGLQNTGGGTRTFTFTKNLTKGQLIIVEAGQTGTHGMTLTFGSTIVNPIKNDGYYAFYVTEDVTTSVTVTVGRLNYLLAMQVLTPSNDTYVVNAVTADGTFLKQIATGSYSSDASVYYPVCVEKDGVYYRKDSNGGSGDYWGYTNIAAGLKSIVYTATDYAYYSEVEDMTFNKNGSSFDALRTDKATSSNRYSGGVARNFYLNQMVYSSALHSGVYAVTLYARNGGSSDRTGISLKLRDSFGNYGDEIASFGTWTSSQCAEKTIPYVLVPEGSSICVYESAGKNSDIQIDYVYVRKVYDVADASKIIGAVDYTTAYASSIGASEHKDLTISQGETLKINFNNHGNGVNNYNNWALRIVNGTFDRTLSAGNHINGTDAYDDVTQLFEMDGVVVSFETFMTDYKTQMMDANVDMTVTYTSAGMFSVKAEATVSEHTYTYTMTYGVAFTGDVTMELGVDCAWLEIISSDKLISATLDASGYATLASAYPLDVTTANTTASTGTVTAYKAAVSGTAVSFTALDQTIPENTGILLKGDANATVTIPVVASGTAVTENAFLVNNTGATFTGDDDYYYFAMKKDAATLTFAKFEPSTLAFPANKAYLKVAETNFAGGAPSLIAIFDGGQTTGIDAVKGSEFTVDGKYYNLAGQRVAQPTKGLYIVNGKKVVVK